MITPAYSLTATERVLPRLALDFTTASLDSRVTVTRALNTATRTNSSGYIETVNADLPRFDFNPSTLKCNGLLIEEARTNLAIQSLALTPSWQSDGTAQMITNVAVSPTGNQDASQLRYVTAAYRYQFVTVTASATYTFSIYAKLGTGGDNTVNISTSEGGIVANLSTGVITSGTNGTITAVGNGWYRLSRTFVAAGASTAIGFSSNGTFTSGQGHYYWGAQLEEGAFPTSYIPTTTTSLTRNSDVVSMTGTNFSDWYNATEGTLQVIGSMNTASTSIFQSFAMIGDANNNLQIFNNLSASRFRGDIYSGGALQKAFTYTAAGAPTSGTTYNIIVGMKANDFAMAINGNTVSTANSGLMPVSPSALYIGSVNTGFQQLGGYVRKLAYYNQKLTNAEIQAFSK